MRFFFKSRKFKIAAAVTALILVISIIARAAGGMLSPQSNLLGTLIAPIQKMATAISSSFKDFSENLKGSEALILENSHLKEQINELNGKVAEYDTLKNENEFYKNYLGIKNSNPDFTFCDAVIISRDNTDAFGGFTIDKGSLDGVEQYDPVITDAGLLGYVTSVGLTSSKVTTILSPEISVAAVDSRTGDSGVISGSVEAISKGYTKLSCLQRSAAVAVGDYVVTAGGGVFPKGILIGKIKNISQDEYTSVLYGEIEPFADIEEARQVMVITDFTGRSIINMAGGENSNE